MALPSGYLTEVQSRDPRLVSWVEIEGLEWGFSTEALASSWTSRWGSGSGSATGPKGVKATLLAPPAPAEISIDPLGSVTTMGGSSVSLHDTSDSLILRAISIHRRDGVLGLSADLTSTATTITYVGTADTGNYPTGGGVIYIDNETIKYTAHDTGTKQFTGCTRGWYGSTAARHPKGSHNNRISYYPRTLKGRRITWYSSRAPSEVSTSDDVVRFRGIVDDYRQIENATGYEIVFKQNLAQWDQTVFRWQPSGEALPALYAGYAYEYLNDPHKYRRIPFQIPEVREVTLEPSEGGRHPWRWVKAKGYNGADDLASNGGISLLTSVHYNGEDFDAYLSCYYSDGSDIGFGGFAFPVLEVYRVDTKVTVPPDYSSFTPTTSVRRTRNRIVVRPGDMFWVTEGTPVKEVWDIGMLHDGMNHWTHGVAPNRTVDKGQHPSRCFWSYKSLNPVDMLLAHCLSTETYDAASDYKWFGQDADGFGINDGWCAWTTDMIDVAACESIRDTHLPHAYVTGVMDEPFVLGEFIEAELLKTWGLVLSQSEDGKATLKRLSIPVGTDISSLDSITEASLIGVPEWSGNAREAYDGLVIDNLADGTTHSYMWDEAALAHGRRARTITIRTKNRVFGPNFQREYMEDLSAVYRSRFSMPSPIITCTTDFSHHDIEVGDAIRLTCTNLPNTNAATLDLSDRVCYVLGKTMDDAAGTIRWKLEVSSENFGRYCKISPTAEVKTTPALEETTIELKANVFTTSPAKDLDAFPDNDGSLKTRVAFYSPDFATLRGTATVASYDRVNDTVTIEADVPGITAGDYMVFDSYSVVKPNGPSAQLNYAFMADNTGDLHPGGTTTEDTTPYQYV